MDISLKFAISLLVYLMLTSIVLNQLNDLVKSYQQKPLLLPSIQINTNEQIESLPRPSIEVEAIKLTLNQTYNLLDYVKASDLSDGDISKKVKVYNNIEIDKRGIYKARFVVENSNHMVTEKIVKVRVD
ncbi:MAG: DUF5011 domain-containing protein [Erysipelotrichaceae bacterium]|nr:DUF5011 domain-containing protein [Erysipelotrichaceae bacterium]